MSDVSITGGASAEDGPAEEPLTGDEVTTEEVDSPRSWRTAPWFPWLTWVAKVLALVALLALASGGLRQLSSPGSYVVATVVAGVAGLLAWRIVGPGHLPVDRPIWIGLGMVWMSAIAVAVVAAGFSRGQLDLLLVPGVAMVLLGYGVFAEGLRRKHAHGTAWLVMFLVFVLCSVLAVRVPPDPWAVGVLLLIAVIAGHLATEMWAGWQFARWDDAGSSPADHWGMRGILMATAVAGIGASSYAIVIGTAHGSIVFTLVVVLAGLALVGVAASEYPVTIVTIVAAVALLTVVPPSQSAPAVMEVGPNDDYFVVLGDSYTSGEGGSRFIDGTNDAFTENEDRTGECRRSALAWPVRLAELAATLDEAGQEPLVLGDVVVPPKVSFVACNGSVTENISTEPYHQEGSNEPSGPAQLALVPPTTGEDPRKPAFVILGIGGNDASFSKIAASCLAPGDCDELAGYYLGTDDPANVDRSRNRKDDNHNGTVDEPGEEEHYEPLAGIGDDLEAAYTAVVDHYEGVPVFVTAYPDAVKATGSCPLFSVRDRDFVVSFLDQLNDKIEGKVTELRARDAKRFGHLQFLGSIEGSLRDGEQLCEEPDVADPGINLIKLSPVAGRIRDALNPGKLAHNSVHPTDAGHQRMLEAMLKGDGRSPSSPDDHEPRSADHPCVQPCKPDVWMWSQIQRTLHTTLPLIAGGLIGWSALWALIASFDRPLGRWLRRSPDDGPATG